MRSHLITLSMATFAAAGSLASAEVYFWTGDINSGFGTSVPGSPVNTNWATFDSVFFGADQAVPGVADLAVSNGTDGQGTPVVGPAIAIASDWTVDSLRLSDTGAVNHTAGKLTIANAPGGDIGLWIGEFGPGVSTYTLNGGVIDILDNSAVGDLQVGRGGGGTFNFNAGSISMVNNGRTIIGLDGVATWNQSSGVFDAHKVDIGLFQSPTATVNLSGNATWTLSDGLLLSDGAANFPNAIRSDLNLTGSGVSLQANGLIVRDKGHLNFVADAGGVSPIVQTGGLFEIAGAGGAYPGLSVNLAAYAPTNTQLTLINGFSIPFGRFDGLVEGAAVPNSGGRVITYRGGADGFDVALVPADQYVAPNPDPAKPEAAIARWSMALNPNAPGPFAEGNPKVLDSRIGVNEGTVSVRNDTPAPNDNLFFFSLDNGHTVVTSTDVPPLSMFTNGNSAGTSSYNAGAAVPTIASEGALFFPQDVYGNEFAFTDSFSVEAFFKTSDGTNVQQILLQGEAFARFGLTMNEDLGGLRFFVNDGSTIETIDIGGSTGQGAASYADGEWHYLLATYAKDSGANGTGLLSFAIADEDGMTTQVTRDLPASFGDLPIGNDGNMLIGAENFGLDAGGNGPRRFRGLIDEVQISAGLVPADRRLGFLDLPTSLLGDANGDGSVDLLDLDILGANFGVTSGATLAQGDFNGDSAVDLLDLDILGANFGSSSPSNAAAVPEPASLALAMAAVLAARCRVR